MSHAPGTQPLAGIRVVVTRAQHQATGLAEALANVGADVALLPLLEIVPPADPGPMRHALARIGSYDWLALSSSNAVTALPPEILQACRSATGPRIATIGPATSNAVCSQGGLVAVEATRHDGGGLAETIVRASQPGQERVLLPQAADARPELADGLREAGFEVETVIAYDKRLPHHATAQAVRLFESTPLGWVIFASPRTVAHFVTTLGDAWPARRRELRAAAIGPTTARALRRIGVEPAVATEPTPVGVVAAIVESITKSLIETSSALP